MVAFFSPPPFMKTRSKAPLLNWTSGAGSTGNTTSATFSNQNIGTPGEGRLVIVCVMGGDNNANAGVEYRFSSVTIGGIPATMHLSLAGTRQPVAIASAIVPTETSANIVVTRSGFAGPIFISVYTLSEYSSAVPYAAYAVGNNDLVLTRSIAADQIMDGSVGIYALTKGATGTVGWAGATQDYSANSPCFVASGSKLLSPPTDIVTTNFASSRAAMCGALWV